MDWCSPGFLEFSIFFGVPLFVEMVFSEQTFYRVSNMRTLTVETLEWMWAWFTLLSFQSGRVKFIVSFTTLCKVTMIVSKMRPITFGMFWSLNLTDTCQVSPFLAIFALRNIWIHVGAPHSSNDILHIESSVNDFFSVITILSVPDINPDDCHVWLGWNLDDS